jgi:hypothetical protein
MTTLSTLVRTWHPRNIKQLTTTENSKPPKHSRAKIQASAAEKKVLTVAKKKEQASLQAAAELENQEKR